MNKKYFGLIALGVVVVALASTTSSLLPTGAGNYSAWTPSTGATHYTLVDETTCNGTTDYVSTSGVGNRDSYTVSLASVPDGAIITGISVAPCASKTTNNKAASMSVFYRLNGSNSADSSAYVLSGATPVELSATSYTGLSVTKTATTTLEAGAVLLSGATTGARLSRLATVVTYITIPPTPFNVGSVATTSTSISVTWAQSSNDQSAFSIEKSTDGVNFSEVATTTGTSRVYTDTGLSAGTYYYKLRAYNVLGYSGYSSTTMTVLP